MPIPSPPPLIPIQQQAGGRAGCPQCQCRAPFGCGAGTIWWYDGRLPALRLPRSCSSHPNSRVFTHCTTVLYCVCAFAQSPCTDRAFRSLTLSQSPQNHTEFGATGKAALGRKDPHQKLFCSHARKNVDRPPADSFAFVFENTKPTSSGPRHRQETA